MIGSPSTLDPYDSLASDLTYAVVRPVYPSLYRFLPDGTPQEDLARSIQERRRSAIVQLRRGLWSNGRPITARDVAASAARATHPSGFAGLKVTVVDQRTVRFSGRVDDWEERLAALTFVLPAGRAGVAYGGPFSIAHHTQGYELALRRNAEYFGPRAESPALTIRFVQDLDLMLLLLERGKLDAAAPLATVNLDQRLDEFGLEHERRLGWEGIWLDFTFSPLNEVERSSLVSGVEWRKLAETFVRADGELLIPENSGDGGAVVVNETLIGSSSDELVALLMRGAWFQLDGAGHKIELLRVDPKVFYGEWKADSPTGVAIRRRTGGPGISDPLGAGEDSLPAFEIATYVTWRPGVEGVGANPTLEGPLWNASEIRRGS